MDIVDEDVCAKWWLVPVMGGNEESQRTVNVVFEDGGFVDGRKVTIVRERKNVRI